MDLTKDIYYDKEYLSLYLKKDEEIAEFSYKEDNYSFYHLAIKRPIKSIGEIKINDNYFDLETAYGYGGYYSNTSNIDFLNRALNKFDIYCKDNNIIAEFSRIHPFNKTPCDIKAYYDFFVLDRKTISVNTSLSTEKRWETYPSKLRTIIRKCKKELTFRKTTNLDAFIGLYEKTMLKNNADDFYYFDKSYFESLLKLKNVELYEVLHNDNVISASFVLFGQDIGHYHLSANDYENRKFNANYFILDSIFDIANEKGIKEFHLGGGRTNTEDDTLLRFKSKFSPSTQNFYISGKIHDKDIYNKYITLWEKGKDKHIEYPKFFLKYRL